PLGAVEYLHELLQLSESSTCDDPFVAPAPGHDTLGDTLIGRRGPLGALKVTRANDGIPLPLMDIVNECLESMSATAPPAMHGVNLRHRRGRARRSQAVRGRLLLS